MSQNDSFSSLFSPEVSNPQTTETTEPWKVLLVDDETDIHAVLRLALKDVVVEGRALQILDAKSAEETKVMLSKHPDIALILLDVVMESEKAGLELVSYIRHELSNKIIQIVLVTGQPGYAPEKEVVMSYEIDGYRLKSELTSDKIFVSVYTALRTHQALSKLEEQRQQLQANTESLYRWRNIFDHAEWGVVVGSADGERFELCNPAFAKQHGYSVEEVMSMSITSVFAPESRASLKDQIAKAHEFGHHTFESSHLRKDGSIFPVLVDVTAVKNEQGKVLYRVVNVQDITERKKIDEFKTFLAQSGSSAAATKEPFFNLLARYLAENLDMDFICIDRLEGDQHTATTVAVWCDGHFEDNVSYALKDTPCGEVVGKEICCYPARICQLFPRDLVLQELQAESYIGVTLWSYTGQPIGLIAVIGRKPLKNRSLVESILKMVAIRAAGELERLDIEDKLNRMNEELELMVEKRTKELELRNHELERMNKAFVGRELKMMELKAQIKKLEDSSSGHDS